MKSPTLPAAKIDLPEPPRKRVRLGLIGLGWVTQNCHLPSLLILQANGWPIEVAVLCDRDEPRLRDVAAGWPEAKTELSADALLARHDLDGVLILTRPEASGQLLRSAMAQHHTTFVEKPVAPTPGEIQQCAGIAGARGVKVQVGYNRRFQPLGRELARRMAGFNPPLHARVQFWRAAREEPHFFDDTLVHSLDFLSHLLGRLQVKEVRTWHQGANVATLDRGWRIDLVSVLQPRVTAEIDIRPAAGRDVESFELLEHKRSLRLQYPHPGAADVHARLIIHEGGKATVFGDSQISMGDTFGRCYHSGFVHQLADFARLCAGEIAAPSCGLDDAVDALRLRDEITARRAEACSTVP